MSSIDIKKICDILYMTILDIYRLGDGNMARDQLQRLSEPMYYLLLTLLEENHGYAMMHDIEMISKGRVKVGTGTLYTLLARFEKEGIICATRSLERKKYYIITEKGKELLKEEYDALKSQIDDGIYEKRNP